MSRTTIAASPVVEQLAAAWLLERADLVLPARRAMLTRRWDVLAGAVAEHLPAWSFRVPDGGLSLWVRLDAPVSSALVQAAERHGPGHGAAAWAPVAWTAAAFGGAWARHVRHGR